MRELKEVTVFDPETTKRVVIVTGGTGSLGRNVVQTFAERGWRVGFQYCKNQSEANALSKEMTQRYGPDAAMAFQYDFLKAEPNFHKEVKTVEQKLGPIGSFIHCSSQAFNESTFSASDISSLESLSQLGLSAFIRVLDACLTGMKYRQNGVIIGILSEALLSPRLSHWATYNASKAALKSYLTDLAVRVKATGVEVYGVFPGAFKTAQSKGTSQAVYENMKKQQIARVGTAGIDPVEVARLIVDLAEKKKPYETGSFVAINKEQGVRYLGLLDYPETAQGKEHLPPPSHIENMSSLASNVEPIDAVKAKLETVFRDVFKLDQTQPVAHAEFGTFSNWDSLQHINLLMSVEQAMKISFSDGEAGVSTSFKKIYDTVRHKLNKLTNKGFSAPHE